MNLRGAFAPLFVKNKEKMHFFWKIFCQLKKKQYLCTAFPPTCFKVVAKSDKDPPL